MRIAQIAPLYESVPPTAYGGTERVVSWLTEELVRIGHDVTLFATAESVTRARLISGTPKSLREMGAYPDALLHHYLMMEKVIRHADEFDVVHSHIDYLGFPFFRHGLSRAISTMHGRLDMESLKPLYEEYNDTALVSISQTQRLPLPAANWRGTIYHGMPNDLYSFTEKPKEYALFLGRICPEKGVDTAIDIALRAGVPLKIGAKVDPLDQEYFTTTIKPLLDQPGIEFIGEVSQAEKNELIGNARALLFPIRWPEPFGLVMIEGMACGTPVIAFNCGSVSEVMEHERSGFICDSADEAIEHLKSIETFDRKKCREVFERRFTVEVMAREYCALYDSIAQTDVNHRLLNFGRLRRDTNVSNNRATYAKLVNES